MKNRMQINSEYIRDRHEAPAEDEASEKIEGPAIELMKRADLGRWVYVYDHEEDLINELVSGAWHYDGMDQEMGYRNDKQIKSYCKTSKRIQQRWTYPWKAK